MAISLKQKQILSFPYTKYDALIADGYAELSTKHFDRFFHGAMGVGASPEEDLMYGDNLLALATFWMLCTLEKDEELLETLFDMFKNKWKDEFNFE